MQLVVNETLKKDIRKKNCDKNKKVRVTHNIEKMVFLLTILSTVIFLIVCLTTGAFVSINMRTGKEDYFGVYVLASANLGAGMTAWIIILALRKRLEDVFIGSRINEMVEIIDNKLFYTFRIKYQTLADKMNLVIIDLDNIDKLEFDDLTRKILITGQMIEKVINANGKIQDINEKEMVNSTLEVFDSFNPSLYEKLINKDYKN